MKILLVDDDAMVLRSLGRILTSRGYEVTIAEGGEAGWKAFNEKPESYYNVIVSDVDMPDLNGKDLKEMLRLTGFGAVILHSGRPENEVLAKGDLEALVAELEKSRVKS